MGKPMENRRNKWLIFREFTQPRQPAIFHAPTQVLLLVIDNCYTLRSSSRAQEMLLRSLAGTGRQPGQIHQKHGNKWRFWVKSMFFFFCFGWNQCGGLWLNILMVYNRWHFSIFPKLEWGIHGEIPWKCHHQFQGWKNGGIQWEDHGWLVVWNMFYFPFHIWEWDVILPIDELIFFKMVETCWNHQPDGIY